MHITIFMLAFIAGAYIHDNGYPSLGYTVILIATADLYWEKYGTHRKAWKRRYADESVISLNGIWDVGFMNWLKARDAAKTDWNNWRETHDVADGSPVGYLIFGSILVVLIVIEQIPTLLADLASLAELIRSASE